MSKPKEYSIDSFEALLNTLNKENVERLSIDLLKYLLRYVTVMDEFRKQHPKETEGKTNAELVQSTFIWVDDGNHDLLSSHIHNTETGEVITINHKQP